MGKRVIVEYKGIKVFIYDSKEGPRAHVHIKHKDGTEAKVWLDDLTFKQKSGHKAFDQNAMALAKEYREEAMDVWEEIYE